MASPIKSLIGQTAVYGMSSIVGRFLNYLLVPLYTYLFLSSEYGVVTELYAYVSILLILLTYGMETGYFRFCQNTLYKRSTVYSTTFTSLIISSLLFVTLLFFASDKVAGLIGYGNNSEYVLLLGLTVALDALSAVPFAKLRIENKAKKFAIIKIINIAINIGFTVFFLLFVPAYFSHDNFIYLWFQPGLDVGYIFLANFLASLITLIILSPEFISAFLPLDIDLKLLKKIFIYSYPLLFAGIAGMMSENLDRILLKYLLIVPEFTINMVHRIIWLPPELLNANTYIMSQIGIYGANVKIAVLMTLFIQAFRYAAEPFFFNYEKNKDSREMYAKVMKYFIVFGLFIFLSVTLFIDYAKYIINPSYHEGLSVVPILLISKLLFGIVFNLSIWYKLTNKTGYGAGLAFFGAALSISFNILLIPLIGYMGSAWSSVITYGSMMIVSFLLCRKYYPIKYDIKNILLYFSLALIFYFINVFSRKITDYYLFLNFLWLIGFVFLFIKIEKINLKMIILSLKS